MNRRKGSCQRGIAAVEFAVILPVLVSFLVFSLFFGRVFWHYTAAQKAAHDAARYLSSVSSMELKTPAKTGFAVAVAQSIVSQELADLNPGPYAPSVTITCDNYSCDGFSLPASITVVVRLAMFDENFYGLTSMVIGDTPLALTASVTMRYVGN